MPNKHFMYSAQVLTQDLYPRVINTIRDLAGGALIMLPSSVHDFNDPELTRDHPHDAALGDDGAGGQGEIPQGGVGRGRLGIRFAPHAIRDVLCGRALRDSRPQLPHLRLEDGAPGMLSTICWRPTISQDELAPQSSQISDAAMKVAIVNLGQIVSGDWRDPFAAGDTILTDGDRIVRSAPRPQQTSKPPMSSSMPAA